MTEELLRAIQDGGDEITDGGGTQYHLNKAVEVYPLPVENEGADAALDVNEDADDGDTALDLNVARELFESQEQEQDPTSERKKYVHIYRISKFIT